MPVKVRCPNCDKSLNAPDAARGKAIKCPGCDTKVRVPAGDGDSATRGSPVGAVKTVKKKQTGEDAMDFLARLDVAGAVDSSVAVCPKCGTEIPEDATECPECGTDPTTGQLSASAKRRVGKKGPDPSEFYSVVWKNSWEFTKLNAKVALRIVLSLFIFQLIVAFCGFMVTYCKPGTPPQFFWGAFGFVANMLAPGLLSALTVVVVQATVSKKNDIRDVNFDMFQNIALGIKSILITIAWFPFGYFMYPLAMIHMSMPVTKKAWIWPVMLPIFFRNLAPMLYFWVIAFVMTIPLAIGGGVISVAFLARLMAAAQTVISPPKTGDPPPLDWLPIVAVAVVAIFNLFWTGFASLFLMRVIGLIAYYYRDTLGLVTLVSEKTYVRKEVKLDAFGVPIKTTKKKVMEAVVLVVALGVIGGVGFFVFRQVTK